MTLDEAIKHEEEIAEENQRVVDTGIVFGDVTIAMLHCDDIEMIEEYLANYRTCANEHHQLAEWLKELKAYKENICSDAVSREQLIRELNAQMAVGAITREIALDMLNHLLSVNPQERTGRWIPVSKRLPEENGRYLVYLNTKVFPIRILDFAKNLNEISLDFNCSLKSKKAGWYDYDSENGFFKWTGVEAWMPLPEPYKAESEDKE